MLPTALAPCPCTLAVPSDIEFGGWLAPPTAGLTLPAQSVHLWRAAASAPAGQLEKLGAILSPDEMARAAAFYRAPDRDRFVLCRGILRTLLGRYLRRPPESVVFDYGAHGKPALAGAPDLHFNISHTMGLCLFAFSREQAVGVDVEAIHDRGDMESTARQCFHPHEWEFIASLPEAQRCAAFYACWTCKEAYLKARGVGLAAEPDTFEVIPAAPLAGDATVHVPGQAEQPWWLHVLDVGPAFAAAVAAPVHPQVIRQFGWRP